MDSMTQRQDLDLVLLPSREPLQQVTTSTSPKSQTLAVGQVHRKPSFHGRYQVDSSEEIPSLHDSIYEAYHSSTTNSEENARTLESWLAATTYGLSLTPPKVGSNHKYVDKQHIRSQSENKGASVTPSETFAVDEMKFRYGKGTVLSTITEKKSTGTIATVEYEMSFSSFANNSRHKKYFSTGDVALDGRSYHEVIAMIEKQTQPINEVYAEPKFPCNDPPIRVTTPPGMPSWDQHQRAATHNDVAQVARPHILRRLFALSPSSRFASAQNATESAPRPATMSRFRPPRSAYGPMNQHPFHCIPVEKQSAVSNQVPSIATAGKPANGRGPRQTISRIPKQTNIVARGKPEKTHTSTPTPVPLTDSITVRTNIDISTAYQPTPPLSHLAYIPPPSYTLPTQRPCTHKISRNSSLKALNAPPPSPCSQYERLVGDRPFLEPLSHPWRSRSPSRQSSQDDLSDSRVIENNDSSFVTTHLMSGALYPRYPASPIFGQNSSLVVSNQSHQPSPAWCWKCNLNSIGEKATQWWARSTNMLYLVCCGADYDVEEVETNIAEVVMMRPSSGLGRVISLSSQN